MNISGLNVLPGFLLLLCFGNIKTLGEEVQVSARTDLVGAIEASIAFGETLEPFRLVCQFETSSEYDDVLDKTGIRRICFSKNAEKEIAVCAIVDERQDLADNSKNIRVVSTIVNGANTSRISGPSSPPNLLSLDSFANALKIVPFPHPAYWVLFKFPLSSNWENELAKLKNRIHSPDSVIRIKRSSTFLEYELEETRGPDHIDTWTWRFGLPQLNATYLRLDRALNGPKRMVFEQELVWEEKDGELRPQQLFGSIGLGRVTPDEKVIFGRNYFDMQVEWLPIDREAPEISFQSVIDVRKYVDAEFARAKLVQ